MPRAIFSLYCGALFWNKSHTIKVTKMADAGEQSGKSITIIVKTPKEKQDVAVNSDATIKEVNPRH
jgi:hypothetical protein